jgi:hypothetical protein
MKTTKLFISTCFVTCLTALPAFADGLGDIPIVGGLFGGHGGTEGAPAPLLAAGIPAFIALGGGALAMKLFRRRD